MGFLDKLMVTDLWKPKKTQVFFGFLHGWFFTCLLKICPKTKKKLSFFWFFALLQVRVRSKTKKTSSFFGFFKVMTKKNQKNSRKTKKNQTWASDQTFSEEFWFFGFLVFSRFRGTSQLFDDSLGEKPWGKPKNIEKTKKPKNQNFSENVWSEVHVWFFLVLPRFF